MRSEKLTGLSRRDFFKYSTAGITAACGVPAIELFGRTAAAAPARIPIAVQLYSVRFECAKDLPGTLAGIAKMGYSGVEFAGYYNRSAAELRKMLDDNRLQCAGTHIDLATLLGDNLQKTIEFNRILGNKLLIVPSLPPKKTETRQGWLEMAKTFDDLAEKVKPHGMRVGYHNHSIEFKPLDGELPWDTFFGNTRKEVVMQVDIGNALEGGADPVAFLKKYPGRAASIHVKEHSKSNPKAFIGQGDVNWKEVFDYLEKTGGTEWYIVEYEVQGVPPMEAIAGCLENLRKMGK
jgi:sugar phosphate isomerase/epimerase